MRTGVSLGDSLAALFGVIGALLALCKRERNHGQNGTAGGQVVDVAIYEAVYALMESLVPEYVLQGKIRQRTGAVLPHVAPSNVYPCADGVSVIIAANADNVFRRLCATMGQPELATDDRFATHQARGEHQAEIDAIVARWTEQHTSEEIVGLMDEAGVPAGPIYTAREMTADPHFRARRMIIETPIEDGVMFPMSGIVPSLSATPGSVRWPGPLEPGSHNREVLCEVLGLSEAEIDSLTERQLV